MKKLAILIGDICGSTALYAEIGDDAARRRIQKGLATMIGAMSAYRGTLVNAVGDQILCTFPNSEAAVKAGCAMQNAVQDCWFDDRYQLKIRIGIHYGEVILGHEAAFGDAVNVTARIAAIANANQIMTTQAVFNELPPALKAKTIRFMSTSLKGKLQHSYEIYTVQWEPDDASVTWLNVSARRKPERPANELTLSYRGQTFRIDDKHKAVTIGRDEECDIIVKHIYASRHHLRCEMRSDKFFLVDTSINGTYVRLSTGKVIYLVREEMILQGLGAISLGQDNFEQINELVEFQVSQ